ncbi:hypothetical protein HYPSUDRAFT_587113 [Hypholoma sublateritium FD-334 SS-4]|uniref:Uncharacterized protein n=1 Tax=Hypholoma sublateritium (strain FD-334 SS-4) TaxID=945553 RepID=A0A0D2NXC9_HYPSF|nr:hypothetical protein HYPSUDRAFT_587113 [Hypholoma sublateritium FD-334 SS-4]
MSVGSADTNCVFYARCVLLTTRIKCSDIRSVYVSRALELGLRQGSSAKRSTLSAPPPIAGSIEDHCRLRQRRLDTLYIPTKRAIARHPSTNTDIYKDHAGQSFPISLKPNTIHTRRGAHGATPPLAALGLQPILARLNEYLRRRTCTKSPKI